MANWYDLWLQEPYYREERDEEAEAAYADFRYDEWRNNQCVPEDDD